MELGRFFSGTEVQYRSNVAVLGNGAYQLLFKASRYRSDRQNGSRRQPISSSSSACSPSDRRPETSTLNQDDFVVMPYTTFQRVYGVRIVQSCRGRHGHAGA